MNYPRIFFILGILVILVPFLGFPLTWKYIILVALGIVIVLVSVFLNSVARAAQRNDQAPASESVHSDSSVRNRRTRQVRSAFRHAELEERDAIQADDAIRHELNALPDETAIDHNEQETV